nr:RNA-directed DNA polymerase, eukaryota [Tanacetum cinerariifolium]
MLQHIGVKSWFQVLRAMKQDFVSDKRVVWVNIEGVLLNVWTRETFLKIESEYISDDESLHGAENKSVGLQYGDDELEDDSDVEGVSATNFKDKPSSLNYSVCKRNEKVVKQHSEDPFNIYDLLKQNPKVLGVGVPQTLVTQAASHIGCALIQKPFRYLGVMVGDCMSRKLAWAKTVQKLHSWLSNWKVKTLSIGGRLTLLKSILDASPLYNMSIYKVPKGVLNEMAAIRSKFFNGVDTLERKITWVSLEKVLASKKNGGLGVSSFHALNRALLLKWVWRFISQDGSLWICRWWDLDWHDLFSFLDWYAWFSAIRLTSRLKIIFRIKMSRDVITVGSTMRIPLLCRDEYSQWRERFMNYLEEQTNGEAMINSIHNDLKFWTAKEKKTRKIDRLARYLLIQELSNDIYSLINSNETAKDLWDALERQMRGSEYGEQDRKAAILYEYETFKAIEGEQLLDTYLRYLQVINDLKKCGYKKDNCELNYKFLNNLQPEWKQYGTLMRQTKNLMDINIDTLYNILKKNQGDVNDALRYKKKVVVVTSDPLALAANKTNVSKQKEKVVVLSDSKGSGIYDFSELKKITAFLVKAFNRRKFYSKPTNNNLRTSSTSQSANKKQAKKINANMVFMAQIKKVLSDSDESSSSAEEIIAEDDDQKNFHDAIEYAIENHIDSQKDYDKSEVDHNDYKEKEHLVDKLIRKFNHKIAKLNTFEEQNNEFNEQIKVLNEKNADLLAQMEVLHDQLKVLKIQVILKKQKILRPSLYDEKVISLGYTLMFLIHSDEALEIEKFKREWG